MKKMCLFLGRACLSLIFVLSIIMKVMHWDGMIAELTRVLGDWSTHIPLTSSFFLGCIPYAGALLAIATALEVFGAFSLLCNYKVRVGAICLIVFLIPVTLLMHAFWLSDLPSLDMMMFCKNVGIIGGLITVATYGE
ncbi:MAG: DoxX family membrane protein [Candidatus Rhabdochlamydia sp.]